MAPIAIEGCIGAGKSLTIEILSRAAGLTVRAEPVEEWTAFLDAAYAGHRVHVALQARIMLDTCCVCPEEDIVERSPLHAAAHLHPCHEGCRGASRATRRRCCWSCTSGCSPGGPTV